MENSFGLVNNTFINLYSAENPILNETDQCFFIFNNILDIHRPLIARGIIIRDAFTDGYNKTYDISLMEIYENPSIINEFFIGKTFELFSSTSATNKYGKRFTMGETSDPKFFANNVFRIEAFFVRDSIEKIIELRKQYISIIKNDLLRQISDIDMI